MVGKRGMLVPVTHWFQVPCPLIQMSLAFVPEGSVASLGQGRGVGGGTGMTGLGAWHEAGEDKLFQVLRLN